MPQIELQEFLGTTGLCKPQNYGAHCRNKYSALGEGSHGSSSTGKPKTKSLKIHTNCIQIIGQRRKVDVAGVHVARALIKDARTGSVRNVNIIVSDNDGDPLSHIGGTRPKLYKASTREEDVFYNPNAVTGPIPDYPFHPIRNMVAQCIKYLGLR
ncbi:MAG: hypothetical protein WC464_03100 [Bdellovibrionales bacterium]